MNARRRVSEACNEKPVDLNTTAVERWNDKDIN